MRVTTVRARSHMHTQSRSAAAGDHRLLPLDADETEWYLTFDSFASWVMAVAFGE
jgi:hypothetical protein